MLQIILCIDLRRLRQACGRPLLHSRQNPAHSQCHTLMQTHPTSRTTSTAHPKYRPPDHTRGSARACPRFRHKGRTRSGRASLSMRKRLVLLTWNHQMVQRRLLQQVGAEGHVHGNLGREDIILLRIGKLWLQCLTLKCLPQVQQPRSHRRKETQGWN